MQIFSLRPDVNYYRGIYYTNKNDIVAFNRSFDGKSMMNTWNSELEFAFIPERLRKSDTPGLSSHIPVFTPRAVEALADFLESNGELLPITCEGKRLFIFNVMRVIDALDEENSELKLFDDGDIMDILRFSFFPEKIGRTTIFKVPQCILTGVFVTEPFVKRVEEANLKGFKFRLLWSND
jgi:hypothetical protein